MEGQVREQMVPSVLEGRWYLLLDGAVRINDAHDRWRWIEKQTYETRAVKIER